MQFAIHISFYTVVCVCVRHNIPHHYSDECVYTIHTKFTHIINLIIYYILFVSMISFWYAMMPIYHIRYYSKWACMSDCLLICAWMCVCVCMLLLTLFYFIVFYGKKHIESRMISIFANQMYNAIANKQIDTHGTGK